MKTRVTVSLVLCAALLWGCSTQKKLSYIRSESLTAALSLPGGTSIPALDTVHRVKRDTIRFTDLEGREVIVMNAIKDESGDMVAHDVIDAAVVTARFRNVAERHGKVALEFLVKVPAEMQDSRWQLRFHPDMHILEDTVRLDNIIITGAGYRKAQLRGYQQYEKFINTIIADTTKFIDCWQLELFLERNIPQIYAFKTDSSFVSDEQFRSVYGVTEREAVTHYTDMSAMRMNERRKSRKDEMFRRYVKAPLVTDGIRLDTVIVDDDGDFIYDYVQTISTRSGLRKVEIVLSGDIYEKDEHIYSIPESAPLTFYISSLSALVDGSERYMTKVIERRVEANTACRIDFALGRDNVDEDLGSNAEEIGKIKYNLRSLLENEKFDLDSITIRSFASPEGTVRHNDALSLRRARSASSYFNSFVREVKDSISAERGIMISVDGDGREKITRVKDEAAEIRFISYSGGENWELLRHLVAEDESLSGHDKEEFEDLLGRVADPDEREKLMSGCGSYKYMREHLYPRLRIVKFDFYLHRRGMVKDTVHTTVIDSAYMHAVELLQAHEYEKSLGTLYDYRDYNTAVALVALDRNASAMEILKRCEPTAPVNYLMALIHSRQGDDEKAVECYMRSCQQDPSYVFRGNLDPEISTLIRMYSLNAEPEDDFGDLSY